MSQTSTAPVTRITVPDMGFVTYEKSPEGIAKITINRPACRNAFRPRTVKEMSRRQYNAQEALDMGLVNKVVPREQLEAETVQWSREILENSPTATPFLKAALDADCDGQAGLQELAGSATLLFHQTAEGREGKEAFVEKRKPDFLNFKRLP